MKIVNIKILKKINCRLIPSNIFKALDNKANDKIKKINEKLLK